MTNPWTRRRFLAMASAGALAAAVRPASAQKRTEVIISQPADAVTLDPGRTTQVLTVNYFVNLYDTLTRWDAALKLGPGLATAWKSHGETTWEVTLRAGVKSTTARR
jgi:peptide/nickel transport system substrate-binding protein